MGTLRGFSCGDKWLGRARPVQSAFCSFGFPSNLLPVCELTLRPPKAFGSPAVFCLPPLFLSHDLVLGLPSSLPSLSLCHGPRAPAQCGAGPHPSPFLYSVAVPVTFLCKLTVLCFSLCCAIQTYPTSLLLSPSLPLWLVIYILLPSVPFLSSFFAP